MEEIKAKILNLPTLTVGLGNIEVQGAGDYPFYRGEYVITPAVDEQTLETSLKVMRDDVTVKAIPYAEVSNLANGKTITIG